MSRQEAVFPHNKPNTRKQKPAAGGKLQLCWLQPALARLRGLCGNVAPAERSGLAPAATPGRNL